MVTGGIYRGASRRTHKRKPGGRAARALDSIEWKRWQQPNRSKEGHGNDICTEMSRVPCHMYKTQYHYRQPRLLGLRLPIQSQNRPGQSLFPRLPLIANCLAAGLCPGRRAWSRCSALEMEMTTKTKTVHRPEVFEVGQELAEAEARATGTDIRASAVKQPSEPLGVGRTRAPHLH